MSERAWAGLPPTDPNADKANRTGRISGRTPGPSDRERYLRRASEDA